MTQVDHPTDAPPWSALLIEEINQDWVWRDRKLIHRDAVSEVKAERRTSPFHAWLVRYVYATQNSSRTVRAATGRLLDSLQPTEWGLNLGAGSTRLHPRILNLDISDSEAMDIVTRGQELPFADNSLSLIISQEVLEHLPEPADTIAEAYRVLRPGGRFYCQIPFIIGYHPGPTDFYRFTKEGLAQLFTRPPWLIEKLEISLGHGSGFYRIAVEYFAVTCSALVEKAYLPSKAFAALAFTPLKVADLLTPFTRQKDRIPGGYFCIARKV